MVADLNATSLWKTVSGGTTPPARGFTCMTTMDEAQGLLLFGGTPDFIYTFECIMKMMSDNRFAHL
jgi:hypothetical protein